MKGKPDPACEECKGIGKILTESVKIHGFRYVEGELKYYKDGKGDWHYVKCSCISMEDIDK